MRRIDSSAVSAECALRILLRSVNCRSSTVRSRSRPLRLASSRDRSVAEFDRRHCRISSTHSRTPNRPSRDEQVLAFDLGDRDGAGAHGESIGGQQQLVGVRVAARAASVASARYSGSRKVTAAWPSSPATGTITGHSRRSRGSDW